MWHLHLGPDLAWLGLPQFGQGCWIVAQRAWVPIYKITLTHPQKMYKKKVKETATIFTAIQRDGNTAGVFPRPLSKLVRKT
jgi:hypothetical protein